MAAVSKDQAEQTPNPGAIVEARIEGSAEGIGCCHQCRQRRTDLFGSCVTKKKGEKTCPMKFCPKCLLNRYGENSEEVALKNDWVCPKCRGICNCSICMKKRGQNPTGILVHTAKATGFSSVSELIATEGADKYFYKKKVKPEGGVVVSPLRLGQENAAEEKPVKIKRSRKTKREELKDINNDCSVKNDAESSQKMIKISDPVQETNVTKKVPAVGKIKKTAAKDKKENNVAVKIKKTKPALKKKEEEDEVEVKPPQGTRSITVSGIDIPPEDAGNTFQFLEFCSAFEKVLDLREGQAECVLRELLSGRSTRRQQYSTVTQMMIQLLTVILEDKGETSVSMSATDGRWFTAIGECLSDSDVQLDDFPPDLFQKGISAYEMFDSSKKLKLLCFLCDEALGTTVLRNFIDNQSLESIEKKKEVKEKMKAAKDKVKQLKQKLPDELAKAVAENNGNPLLIAERDAIVSRVKAETKEAHLEIEKEIEMLSKESQGYDDVLRTNPVAMDENGLVFWRLKSYNEEPNILVQDLGRRNGEVCPQEKWFAFNPEQKPEIDEYISFIRKKEMRKKKKAKY